MVGVVEQQPEAAALGAPPADLGHQHRIAPLVHDHQVDVRADRFGDGHRVAVIGRRELRIGCPPGLQPALAMILLQVGETPGFLGLEGLNLMAAPDELTQHAALEMGVAVVPAGGEGMGEIGDLHAAAPCMGVSMAASSR